MEEKVLSTSVLVSLLFVSLASLPTELRAQTCTLHTSLATALVDAAPTTKFLASGGEGQIMVRRKYPDSSVVHIFETPEPQSSTVLSEPAVISVKAMPEKADESFLPSDSSVIRFIVPTVKNSFWERRTFVVRFCGQGGEATAIVRVRISPPIWAKLISVGFLLLLYVGFALALSTIRGQPHKLTIKYPAAFANRRHYGWLRHLDPVVLTANAFNKGSMQKLQVLFFHSLSAGWFLHSCLH
jgi:hypothetical protein